MDAFEARGHKHPCGRQSYPAHHGKTRYRSWVHSGPGSYHQLFRHVRGISTRKHLLCIYRFGQVLCLLPAAPGPCVRTHARSRHLVPSFRSLSLSLYRREREVEREIADMIFPIIISCGTGMHVCMNRQTVTRMLPASKQVEFFRTNCSQTCVRVHPR
jgi:hypothetical protein